MDQEKLNAIKDRVKKVSVGPWIVIEEEFIQNISSVIGAIHFSRDAHFIAHAREDVPALVAEVERLNSQSIIKHFCNAAFIGAYPLSAILEPKKSLSEGSLFTVEGKGYLVLNIMVRSATEILVETKRT
ncbi:hypothetical protein [Lysinibacillus sphaericus]|uniref:hypothetical protein n=1 Tax=Lysinibacillus sphaericus TaxID=1421 RepID=UPI003D05E661